MKKKLLFLITLILLIKTSIVDANYRFLVNNYVLENVISFIKSPNKDDLINIKDINRRFCEKVYLEATRRRNYSNIELTICWNFFEMKNEQELDYIRYMQNNRLFYN